MSTIKNLHKRTLSTLSSDDQYPTPLAQNNNQQTQRAA